MNYIESELPEGWVHIYWSRSEDSQEIEATASQSRPESAEQHTKLVEFMEDRPYFLRVVRHFIEGYAVNGDVALPITELLAAVPYAENGEVEFVRQPSHTGIGTCVGVSLNCKIRVDQREVFSKWIAAQSAGRLDAMLRRFSRYIWHWRARIEDLR